VILNNPNDLESLRQNLMAEKAVTKVWVCAGPGCLAKGSRKIYDAFLKEGRELNLEVDYRAGATGCQGFCEKGPLVTIELPGNEPDILYMNVKVKDVSQILEKTVLKGEIIESLLYRDPLTKERCRKKEDIPYYATQKEVVLGHLGHISPLSIDDYIRAGGYAGLAKAISESPEEVVGTVKASGLRGRGGAGFPTGVKWEGALKQPVEDKYVVANGDEGDPGAFMDRALMEGDPHAVIEGLIIGGYAIGAHNGILYVRNEYPLAVEHLRHAIAQAEDYGLLGDDILGSGFGFRLSITRGGGAFVCGESTALMNSIEGLAGVPRVKYIRSTEKGLWEAPAVLNNVESWANIPQILANGSEWFSSMGTEKSAGTKVFSLVGKVKNSGLVEVPMGTTLREIIEVIGGGVANNRKFKAVQSGGPSGGCLPAEKLDSPVDFERLKDAGSMMGSGGLIVMDDHTCMVNVAQYFVDFLVEESCGKCTPCREGLRVMQQIFHDLTSGNARPGDTELLKKVAENVRDTALCGLGKTAANPVLSTMRFFPEEYAEHEQEGFCRAGVCKGLYALEVDPEACTGCGLCMRVCPASAVTGEKKAPHFIDKTKCVTCGSCLDACRFDAIRVVRGGMKND